MVVRQMRQAGRRPRDRHRDARHGCILHTRERLSCSSWSRRRRWSSACWVRADAPRRGARSRRSRRSCRARCSRSCGGAPGALTDPSAQPQGVDRMSVSESLGAMPIWTFDVWRSHVDEIAAGMWWSAYALVVVASWRRTTARGRARRTADGSPGRRSRAPAAVYLTTPFRIGGAAMLNVRLAPVLTIFALVGLRLRRDRRGALALGMASIAAVGHGGQRRQRDPPRGAREDRAARRRALRDGAGHAAGDAQFRALVAAHPLLAVSVRRLLSPGARRRGRVVLLRRAAALAGALRARTGAA